jgi:hypothetical protein
LTYWVTGDPTVVLVLNADFKVNTMSCKQCLIAMNIVPFDRPNFIQYYPKEVFIYGFLTKSVNSSGVKRLFFYAFDPLNDLHSV